MARRNTGPSWEVREQVRERDQDRCAACGISIYRAGTWSWHHRRNRGSGGSRNPAINSPANLLLLCGDGTALCHGYITAHPAEARADGRSVSLNSTVDPADLPVWHAVHGRVLLDHDGGWLPA
jgi:5-methylcytosine-specific restriction protein A